MSWIRGDEVMVRDPDGVTWRGLVHGPSVLWKNWYVVRPKRLGGKAANYHVHASEIERTISAADRAGEPG